MCRSSYVGPRPKSPGLQLFPGSDVPNAGGKQCVEPSNRCGRLVSTQRPDGERICVYYLYIYIYACRSVLANPDNDHGDDDDDDGDDDDDYCSVKDRQVQENCPTTRCQDGNCLPIVTWASPGELRERSKTTMVIVTAWQFNTI